MKKQKNADAELPQLKRTTPWPFKLTLQDNRWYVNKTLRRKQPKPKFEEAPF